MKTRLLGLIACIALACTPAAANTITYTLDDTVGSLTVTGTITTDGAIGFLSASACCVPPDILDWNLTITNGTISEGLLGPLSSGTNSFVGGLTAANGSFVSGTPSVLLATSQALIWNYSPTAFFNIQTNMINLASVSFGGNGFSLQISPPSGPAIAYTESLTVGVPFEFASATPLPAALPLFATGLGVLGLLGWSRKRKNAAAFATA